MTNILAIDQGTSGTKAIVADDAGQVLAIAEQPLHPLYFDGGGVEQDPGALLDSVLTAGRRAAAEAGVPLHAVALANQGETVLAWDRATGRPLSPAVVWQDRRAEALCARLAGSAGRVAALTGLVLDPYFSAPKMRWLRENVTTGGVVTTSDTWLVHQLCGAFVTDASTASRSLLTGQGDLAWNTELLEVCGLAAEPLPAIVPNDAIVGTTQVFGGELKRRLAPPVACRGQLGVAVIDGLPVRQHEPQDHRGAGRIGAPARVPQPGRLGGVQLQAEPARHLQLHVGAGGVPRRGDGDPQPPVEIQAGRHITDHHVEHVQVRRAIAAHVRSLPEQASARTARRRRTRTDPRPDARADACRLSLNNRPLPDQAMARTACHGERVSARRRSQ